MLRLINRLRSLRGADRRGVTALEYGLIAAVIGGVIITGASTISNGLGNSFTKIGNTLTRANS